MSNPTPLPTAAELRRLQWRKDGGVLFATEGTCLYMRETSGSVISGLIFGTLLCLGLGGSGVKMLMEPAGTDGKWFGGFAVLLGLFFGLLVVVCLRRGRWVIVYDRGSGQPGSSGEIRYRGGRLAADRIRCLTTTSCGGGSMPNRMVTAELHDGTRHWPGPTGVSTWPGHWAKQAADWMNLPYRESGS
jgi:hypothetical protein